MNETEIANLALARVGVSQTITSLNEQTTLARICRRFYEFCRQHTLRAHPWGFASTVSAVAAVSGQTYPGWQYVYQYPNDALMVWAVADESGIRNGASLAGWYDYDSRQAFIDWNQRYPFKLALSTDRASRVLLSDIPSAYAYFTFDVSNTNLFPPDFVSALASRLAMEIGGPLSAKAELVNQAKVDFLFWSQNATAQNMNEQRDDRRPESESISCRV